MSGPRLLSPALNDRNRCNPKRSSLDPNPDKTGRETGNSNQAPDKVYRVDSSPDPLPHRAKALPMGSAHMSIIWEVGSFL